MLKEKFVKDSYLADPRDIEKIASEVYQEVLIWAEHGAFPSISDAEDFANRTTSRLWHFRLP